MPVRYVVAILASATLLAGSAAFGAPSSVTAPTGKTERNQSRIQESQARPPAGQQPAASAPQRVETTKYDSWVVVCEEGGTAKKTCSATLRASSQNARQVLLNWRIGVNKDGHFVTAFHVPPAMAEKKGDATVGGPLLIQNGLELKFGNGPPRRISYIWCGPQQCVAEALIDDAFIKEAVANTNAVVTVYTLGGGPITIELPIKGIDKAISSTRK